MKTRILTATLLMSALVSFAQTSRRESSERKNNEKQEEKGKNNGNQRIYSGNSTGSSDRRENHPVERREDHRVQPSHTVVVTDNRRTEHEHGNPHHSSHEVIVYNDHRRHDIDRRTVVVTHPRRAEVHRVRYYRAPVRTEIYWTVSLSRDFRVYYPEVHYWKYPVGHRIASVPAYDARNFIGEVANVYGRVLDMYYEPATDDFFLYFGDYYPYQDFSIVMPGHEARELSRDPIGYFSNQHIAVTGYIQNIDGQPQIIVGSSRQIDMY
jgi:hypothetical protein